ncbi:MAG TPA: SUMF1/EgtB/PvdO family nonheme iron enzyme, partial [Anaerolineales bacterium]|nr:SUMF1/EgtB/PvdO family nonheme iron enzyme [Anaerolineales bacterium]
MSNKDYASCIDSGTCAALRSTSSFNRRNYFRNSDFDDFPVVWVTLEHASIYCNDYLGGSLPTEFEWEIAARGRDDWAYSWDSDSITASDANLANAEAENAKVDTS